MLNFIFLSFAFGAGLAAFFSPCSVTLLPAYITYYLSNEGRNKTKLRSVLSGLSLGLVSIIGFFTVFGISGALVILFGQVVKRFIPSITIITGIFLIVIGISILSGKNFLLRLPSIRSDKNKGAYVFGVSYAVAALGCTFPLFATVLLQAIADSSMVSGFLSLFAYIFAMSILMVGFTITTSIAKDFLQKKLNSILPYIHKFSAVLIIGAGIYMIYYQSLLL